jgi:hypothetical protein
MRREGDVRLVQGNAKVQVSKPKTWFDQAVDDPKNFYATPAEVLRDERLDEAGMRVMLEAWARGARGKGEATPPSRQLRDVEAALAELDRLVAADFV